MCGRFFRMVQSRSEKMSLKHKKSKLIELTANVQKDLPLSPEDMEYFLGFQKKSDTNKLQRYITRAALPVSLALGFFYSVFPREFAGFIKSLPSWTNLPAPLLSGIDYLWNLLGEPVGQANIIFHIPNIMLYAFSIFGLKKLFDAIDRRNWLDRVLAAQTTLRTRIENGAQRLNLRSGHSILFVGRGDFIGMQFIINHAPNEAVTVSETKPSYTSVWSCYTPDSMYENLRNVIDRCDAIDAGEYIFFPVKDDRIFLPPETAYDLSPHKLDILCQNIRMIERENKWSPKRIIIVGDRYHKSTVYSEGKNGPIKKSEDIISLQSVAAKYKKVTLLDPTDIVMKKIIEMAAGRQIVFRATREGMKEYKNRFYDRLAAMKYIPKKNKKGILTIGYDIFEDLTEQQMLARKVDDYFPVVLSKNIRDALLRNGHKSTDFIYVPELVLKLTAKTAAEQ